MKPLNRYQLVREWWIPTMGLSAPLLLDKQLRTLRPYYGLTDGARHEWAAILQRNIQARRLPHHPMPTLAAFSGRNDCYELKLLSGETAITQTTLALDSNYANNSAGDAIAGRFQVHATRTLQDLYYYITAYTGTAANVNDINIEIRPEASVGATTPHTATLTDSATSDPASATGWIKTTGLTAALTAAARYFAIVGDADGSGTDYATVLAQCTLCYDSNTSRPSKLGANRTTGGWASGNTAVGGLAQASLVLTFADGSVTGSPLTTSTTPASDTNQRGLRLTTSALAASLDIFGITWVNSGGNLSGIKIYAGDAGPGSGEDHTSTDILFRNTAAERAGCMVASGAVYRLTAGTAYSLVATYSAASTSGPRRHDIGTGEDANLRLAMPGNGNAYFRRANGSTDWSNDLVGSIPDMGVLIDAQVAASGGGLIMPRFLGGGMT